MFLPFFAAIANAGGIIIDKVLLGKRRMAVHVFIPVLFLFLFVFTALLVPLLGRVDSDLALQPSYLFLFVLMIVLSITWNVFYYQSIQKEKLYEHELIIMLEPLMTILLASVFFPEDLDMRILGIAIVAGVALFVSRLERDHFAFDRYSLNLMLAVMLMALESIIIKELLSVYSPVSLYAFRTGFIFLFFLIYYRPRLAMVSATNLWWVMGSSLLGVIYMILRFYGYRDLGIVHTTLILIISPVLVYIASSSLFNERVRIKTVVSGLIILSSIIYVTYIDFISR